MVWSRGHNFNAFKTISGAWTEARAVDFVFDDGCFTKVTNKGFVALGVEQDVSHLDVTVGPAQPVHLLNLYKHDIP
jgi:hypothetical protein